MNIAYPEPHPPMDLTWIRWLLDSYALWLKRELIDRTGTIEEQWERLYVSPFVVASHINAEDPILNYGNRQALALWEMTWQEFTATPSRLTAEPLNQTERARMLEQAATQGVIMDYQGVRISRTGRRFLVKQATVWNVLDGYGITQGQAATFSQWEPLTEDETDPSKRGCCLSLDQGLHGLTGPRPRVPFLSDDATLIRPTRLTGAPPTPSIPLVRGTWPGCVVGRISRRRHPTLLTDRPAK